MYTRQLKYKPNISKKAFSARSQLSLMVWGYLGVVPCRESLFFWRCDIKWFKHETKRKAAHKRLIMEFGIEGYGLYHVCLELIAGDITIDNLTFELEEDAELIAHEFKMDTIKVEKIMHRCIELGLFDLADNGRLRCLSLAKMLDESISKNHNVKEMKVKIKEKLENSGYIPESLRRHSDQIRLDEIRLDEKREKKKGFQKPSLSEIQQYLNDEEITEFTAESFYNFYESKGWMIGKNKMKCWKRAVATWKGRYTAENKTSESWYCVGKQHDGRVKYVNDKGEERYE